jgi:glycosyltransferase involved in cell wall biosynthesis
LLHVTDTFLPKIGGAEIAIDSLVRTMNSLGAKCEVLAQRSAGTGADIEVPYRLHRFAAPRSALWAGWWIGRHIKRLEKEGGPFDAYIGHHAFPPGYAVTRRASEGQPAIVHVRGGDIYYGSRFRKKMLAWRRLTWALRHAAAVVCLSAAMEELVKEIVGSSHVAARGDRIVRIPNGIDLQALRAEASGSKFAADKRLEGPFVLGLGRTIRRKGFHLLIEAFGRVAARHADWRLVIAGDGRERAQLQRQARELGERVIFTGLVEGADKRWLLQHARFVAMPSLEESFPNVALESIACGKPVIGSKTGGFGDVIREGYGKLVEVGNASLLAEALEEYMRVDLGAESRAAWAAAEGFSWERTAARYLELVGEVRGDRMKEQPRHFTG